MYIRAAVTNILDESSDVQYQEACNCTGRSAQSTLIELADSPFYSVRQAVASNEYTPSVALRKLLKDPILEVRMAAMHNLNRPCEFNAADIDNWKYSNVFEYTINIGYPNSENQAACDAFIEDAVSDYVNIVSHFNYEDGYFYDYGGNRCFTFRCEWMLPDTYNYNILEQAEDLQFCLGGYIDDLDGYSLGEIFYERYLAE